MPLHAAEDKSTETGKRDFLSRLLLVLGILLLLAALGIAGYLGWQYLDAQNRYRDIQSISGLEVEFGQVVAEDTGLEDLHFDWDALRAANPDVVGWIIVPGTHINYPVVQGPDNDYYLHRLFDATSSGTGAIFSDYQGNRNLDALNNIIYGHNMLDESMFADINKYVSADYFNEHSVIYLGTPARNFELQALATIKIDQNAPLREFAFTTDEQFKTFTNDTFANPVVAGANLDAIKQEPAKLYFLVTCDTVNNSLRTVLGCSQVRSVVQGE